MPGDLEEPRTEEEDHPGIIRRAELPVDGQAQDITVEAAAVAQIAGPHQNSAAQNLHVTIPSSRSVTQEAARRTAEPICVSAVTPGLGQRWRAEQSICRLGIDRKVAEVQRRRPQFALIGI